MRAETCALAWRSLRGGPRVMERHTLVMSCPWSAVSGCQRAPGRDIPFDRGIARVGLLARGAWRRVRGSAVRGGGRRGLSRGGNGGGRMVRALDIYPDRRADPEHRRQNTRAKTHCDGRHARPLGGILVGVRAQAAATRATTRTRDVAGGATRTEGLTHWPVVVAPKATTATWSILACGRTGAAPAMVHHPAAQALAAAPARTHAGATAIAIRVAGGARAAGGTPSAVALRWWTILALTPVRTARAT